MAKARGRLRQYTPFQQGQCVWLEGKNLAITHPTVKLEPKQYGPLQISRVISPVVYQLTLPAQWKQRKLHDVFHASLLTPYRKTEAHGANFLEPPPDIIDGEDEYKVEQVLDSKKMGQKQRLHYLIQWKGYSEAHDTWEPEENVRHVADLVRAFHERHPLAVQNCYLNNEDQVSKTPSLTTFTSMSANGSQNSLQSDLSHVDWRVVQVASSRDLLASSKSF
jgi:hypothetical protein